MYFLSIFPLLLFFYLYYSIISGLLLLEIEELLGEGAETYWLAN